MPRLCPQIGAKYNKSAAQTAIGFQVNRGVPTFPKSIKAERIAANLDCFFELSPEDLAEIAALDKGLRTGWGGPRVDRDGRTEPRDLLHPHYPFQPDPAQGTDAGRPEF